MAQTFRTISIRTETFPLIYEVATSLAEMQGFPLPMRIADVVHMLADQGLAKVRADKARLNGEDKKE